MWHLRQLDLESAHLQKLVVERDLEIEVVRVIAVKNDECTRPAITACLCQDARPGNNGSKKLGRFTVALWDARRTSKN